MSNLNVNNIDVQRIINLMKELDLKINFCSILTFKTLEKINSSREEIITVLQNEEFMRDLDEHFELMRSFKDTHLEIKEEDVKESEKSNEVKEDEVIDSEDQNQNMEKIIKRENLQDIDENKSDKTKFLAKNTRNLCRKYYKNAPLIEYLKRFRSDPELITFTDGFEFMLKNSTKKCKMTFEEEKSDLLLNAHLTEKIIDLEKQITEKQNKYEKLKKERQDFKTNCINKIQEIEREIEMIKNSTEMELSEIENKINKDLNDFNETNQKNIQELKEKVSSINSELEKKKNDNELIERGLGTDVNGAHIAHQQITDQYDNFMDEHKENMDSITKEILELTLDLENKNKLRDKLKKKYLAYEAAHKKHQERLSKLKFDEDVKFKAAEWIQAQFRGFFIRKTKRKNYKFLNVLKKPDPAPAQLPNKK